jgi:hypothetical protein
MALGQGQLYREPTPSQPSDVRELLCAASVDACGGTRLAKLLGDIERFAG